MPAIVRTWTAIVALLAIMLTLPSLAAADELVKFAPAAPVPQAAGAANQPDIQGYLTRPPGTGPFPAVVVLHSCLGLRADRRVIAKRLSGWGYVSLFVDDFATRGLRETCAVDFPEGLADAFGALAFLSTLPYVDPTRIGVLGYSQGAATALEIAVLGAATGFAIPRSVGFRAAAAFYPACDSVAGARLRISTLILVGTDDTVTPAAACERLTGRQSGEVKLVVYPSAAHVFDDPQFAGGKSLLGMHLEFNQGAALASQSALRAFLAAKLAR